MTGSALRRISSFMTTKGFVIFLLVSLIVAELIAVAIDRIWQERLYGPLFVASIATAFFVRWRQSKK